MGLAISLFWLGLVLIVLGLVLAMFKQVGFLILAFGASMGLVAVGISARWPGL